MSASTEMNVKIHLIIIVIQRQLVKISLAVSAVNAIQDLLAMESRVYKIHQKMQFLSR